MDRFIVVFTSRLNIGLTAIPYHAAFHENSPIELLEHVTPEHLSQHPDNYSEEEKQVVKLLHTISEKELHKKFSREKTLREFKQNIPEKILNERIRPDIENKMYKLVKSLASSSVPSYFKQSGYSNLYQTDKLKIPATPCEPIFRVDVENGRMHYSLKFQQDGQTFTFRDQQPQVICSDPAVLKAGQTLYYFEKFDSGKLKPFREKSIIQLNDEKMIDTYMDKFISKVVEKFHVEGSGFDVMNINEKPGISLHIEKNLSLRPVIRLRFHYGKRVIEPNRRSEVFVDYVKKEGRHIFHRYPRDFQVENNAFQLLKDGGLQQLDEISFGHPHDSPERKNESAVTGPENLIEWIREYKPSLDEHGITIHVDFDDQKFNIQPVNIQFDAKNTEPDWFDIHCIVEIPPHKIPFPRFRKNILNGDRRFVLPDGNIFIIPSLWFTRYYDLFNFGKTEDEHVFLPKNYYHLLDEIRENEDDDSIAPIEMPRLKEFESTSLPGELNAALRPYQVEGYQWMIFLRQNHFGGILADDMGLGKTLQTIALFLKIYRDTPNNHSFDKKVEQLSLFGSNLEGFNQSGLPPSLIVMPTSLVHNWVNELKKFAPTLKVYIYTGVDRPRSKDLWKILRHYHVVITTYGILRNDVEYLKRIQWEYLVLDESQHIKNPSSKGYESVTQINARHHLALTGTPIENSLTDLWAQMNVVNEGLLKSLHFFKRYYATPISRNEDQEKSEHLQKIINPFLLRRTKDMVARDLPPIMEQVVYCDMTPEQQKFYERERSGIRNHIFENLQNSSDGEQAIIALQALTRLRQISNHPAMLDPEYKGSSGKFEQMMESLENIISENHHVLIFSSFVKDLKLTEKELNKRKIPYAKLIGETRKREKVIDEFNNNNHIKVFLISLKAGGIGLNLTKADYVFMLNPWWNPASESQAIDRTHRIGQTRNVFVYRFISTDTIEEKIAGLQEKKSRLAEAFVNTTNPLTQMSVEELKELFA
ncbi:MAG: DEAD/DEAH box helicase [Marinilabiliaceae bacterium]